MKNEERILAKVCDELRWVPGFRPTDIQVAVTGGVVMLAGHVADCAHRFQAECAARRVAGVSRIANALVVTSSRANATS